MGDDKTGSSKVNPVFSVPLGGSGLTTTRLGMGCWAIGGHGWGPVRDEDSIRAIQYAFEAGCTFFDTADVYGLGHSENILQKALGDKIAQAVIATKGGVRWNQSGRTWRDCSPRYLEHALDESLHRLGLDVMPLYYVHWLDGVTPIQEVIEVMAQFRDQGKIKALGVSNFTCEQLLEAVHVARIDAVQVKFNLLNRDQGLSILPICRQYRIMPVFYGALADGLLTGKFSVRTTFDRDDHRSRSSDFQDRQFLDNLRIVDAIKTTETAKIATTGQIAIRWILDEIEGSAVLFGAKTAEQVDENLRSEKISLSASDHRFISNLSTFEE